MDYGQYGEEVVLLEDGGRGVLIKEGASHMTQRVGGPPVFIALKVKVVEPH